MMTTHKTIRRIRTSMSDARRGSFSDYQEYRRGRKDGAAGLPLASISEVYVEGYILGRMILHRIRKN